MSTWRVSWVEETGSWAGAEQQEKEKAEEAERGERWSEMGILESRRMERMERKLVRRMVRAAHVQGSLPLRGGTGL